MSYAYEMPAAREPVSADLALAGYRAAKASASVSALAMASHGLASALEATIAAPPASSPRKAKRQAAASTPCQAFAAALAVVMGAMDRRNTIPILDNVRIVAEPGTVTISGTNLDMVATARVSVGADFPRFDVTAPAQSLAAMFKGARGDFSMAKGAVSYSEDGKPGKSEPGKLAVRIDGAESVIPTLPAGDFPIMAPSEGVTSIMIDGAELVPAIKAVAVSISTEETRYYLTGAYFHVVFEDGRYLARLVSTDGRRMVVNDLPGAVIESPGQGVIIPRKAVDWIARNAGAGSIIIEACPAKVTITTDAGEMTTKTIDGSFPDYTRVIPREVGSRALTFGDTDEACKVISRLIAQSGDKSRSVNITAMDGEALATVKNMDGAEFTAALPCDVEGEAFEVGFNGAYLLAALASSPSAVVKLTARAGAGTLLDAVRVDYPDVPERLAVLMPLRA